MSEEKLIFRGYLRGLLRHLNTIKATPQKKDFVAAEQLVDELIEDTKQGITD